MGELRIGRVAAMADVSVDTVRFYERRGLLSRAKRERSGYRVFDEAAVERLRLIRALAALGLGLDEIAAMLDGLVRGASCRDERPRLAAALRRADEQLAALEIVRGELRRALARCDAGSCEIVDRARSCASGR